MEEELTVQEAWFAKKYKFDLLPLCEICKLPYGTQAKVTYGCAHYPIEIGDDIL